VNGMKIYVAKGQIFCSQLCADKLESMVEP